MATIPGPPGMSDAVQPNPLVTSFPVVDSFTLASFPMPGKWTLVEAKLQFGWQIQKGFGLTGAFVLPTGDELVIARFRAEFWAMSDWAIYKQLRKQLYTKPVFSLGGVLLTAAMGIDHPTLKGMGVTQVVVYAVHGEIQEEGGLWTQVIEFLQYRPPLPALPKPKTVIPDIASPAPTAQDAQEVEIQKLTAQVSALQGA